MSASRGGFSNPASPSFGNSMMRSDPDFPNLPFVPDKEFEKWTELKKVERHVLEVAESAKVFDARQAAGMNIFDATEKLSVPRMNRGGLRSNELRKLYGG
jgi:hypothetical protein